MVETTGKDIRFRTAVALFTLLTIWWLILQITNFPKTGLVHQLFAVVYGVMALLGGVWGIKTAKHWGGMKSVIGKAILMFSFGLLAQEFGQLTYSYYYFIHAEIPYPSIGDIGYFGTIPLYTYGVFLLAKASGVKFSLQSLESKIQSILIPFILLMSGYLLFLQGYIFDWSNPLKIFLDFGYPLGEAIYISLALLTFLLSRKILGGIMKDKILFILFALCIQFTADYTFLYQSGNNSFYAGGIVDYFYLFAYTVMTMALLELNTTALRLKNIK